MPRYLASGGPVTQPPRSRRPAEYRARQGAFPRAVQALIVCSYNPGLLAEFWAEGPGRRRVLEVLADPEGNEFCVLSAYSPEVRAQWRIQHEAYQRLD